MKKKLDYEFYKDFATAVSYLLFAVSFLGDKFFPNLLIGLASFCCVLIIIGCIIKMFLMKRNG